MVGDATRPAASPQVKTFVDFLTDHFGLAPWRIDATIGRRPDRSSNDLPLVALLFRTCAEAPTEQNGW